MYKSIARKKLRTIAKGLWHDYSTLANLISYDGFILGLVYIASIFSLRKALDVNIPPRINSFHEFDLMLLEENEVLSHKFPKVSICYGLLKNHVSKEMQSKFLQEIGDIYRETEIENYDLVSWFYQYLLENIKKTIYDNSLSNGKKIVNADILPVTQFFTENYMVKFITSNTLDILKRDNRKLR